MTWLSPQPVENSSSPRLASGDASDPYLVAAILLGGCFFVPSKDTSPTGLRAHPTPAGACLNMITSAMTLFPPRVPFAASSSGTQFSP